MASSGDAMRRSVGNRWAAFWLVLAATLSLVGSYVRFMWNDEFFSFYTDGMPSFADVVRVQLHHPLNIDPPTYHLLSHACMDLLGRNALALRLPAMAGYLVLLLCLFVYVRRIAGERAALVAMAFPLLTGTAHLAVDGRPYALLAGMYALALTCWQTATRQGSGRARLAALVGLWLAIMVAVTSHYFGMLILLPVCLAEAYRTVAQRRIDQGMWTAIVLGIASIGWILPFRAGTLAYRQHYYIGAIDRTMLGELYRSVFQDHVWPAISHRGEMLLIILFMVAVAAMLGLRLRRTHAKEPLHEWVALLAVTLLPVFTYLFGQYVTHAVQTRYASPAIFGVAALAGIAVAGLVRRDAIFYATMAGLVVASLVLNGHRILEERATSRLIVQRFALTPEVQAALEQNPATPIYVQGMGEFFTDYFYDPDPRLHARLRMLCASEEVGWLGSDTGYVTMQNMRAFTSLPIAGYDELLAQPKPLVMVFPELPGSWVDRDLAARGLHVQVVGPMLGGSLLQVERSSK